MPRFPSKHVSQFRGGTVKCSTVQYSTVQSTDARVIYKLAAGRDELYSAGCREGALWQKISAPVLELVSRCREWGVQYSGALYCCGVYNTTVQHCCTVKQPPPASSRRDKAPEKEVGRHSTKQSSKM